jgi:hypothetical protein
MSSDPECDSELDSEESEESEESLDSGFRWDPAHFFAFLKIRSAASEGSLAFARLTSNSRRDFFLFLTFVDVT